ncbi:MAG: hypothetical protein QOG64_1784 [Acidimicrobiaceae bacterium]|nr:hypothetical protein [Acidimicrobiaceae bacterium]
MAVAIGLAPAGHDWGRTRRSFAPAFVAASLAGVGIALGWRGGDLAAQVFRVDLFRQHGFLLWNDQWFGGHATLNYSVLLPLIGWLTGPLLLGALSSVVAAVCVDRILRAHFGPIATVGSVWFAASTVTNVAVGRITFSLGMAFGVGALLALQRDRRWVAAALGLLCALASPVAAVFLIIAIAAWGSTTRARWLTAGTVLAATGLPLLALGLAFPGSGVFPFNAAELAVDLAICAVVLLALPVRQVVLRRATVLFALATVAVYAVPNALGGNVSRLPMYAAGPIVACVLLPARRSLLALLALPLLFWQWSPAFDGMVRAGLDPSTRADFYQPLLDVLHQQPGGPSRVEIPVTQHHWESVYVAETVSLARGWERQLDISLNPVFYNGTLDAGSYERWLSDEAVRYIALPAAPIDYAAAAEARLLTNGLPYLTPVWQNADWRVWRFDQGPGLVSGPAAITELGAASFTVKVSAPGDVLVRVRASGHWAVPAPGCATVDPSGWTLLRDLPTGSIRVAQAVRGTPCPPSDQATARSVRLRPKSPKEK